MQCLWRFFKERRLKKKQLQEETSQEKEFESNVLDESTEEKEESVTQDTTERKESIWQQQSSFGLFHTSSLLSAEEFDLQFRYANWKSEEAIALFSISESKLQHLELEKFFGNYTAQIYHSKRLQSSTLTTAGIYGSDNVINLYKKFDFLNDADKKVSPNDSEFRHKLFRQLFYITPQSELKQNIYLHRDKYVNINDAYSLIGDTRWLKLVSWWKLVNSHLIQSSLNLHKCLRNSTEFKLKTDQNAKKLTTDLYRSLIKLNLTNSSAEASAIKIYANLYHTLPDIEMWSFCGENSYDGLQQNFFRNVKEDSLWIYFLTECTHHVFDLISITIGFLTKNEKILNMSQKIRTIVKNLTENFFYSVAQPLLDKEYSDENLKLLINDTQTNFEEFVAKINMKKNSEKICSFETVVLIVSRILVVQMKLVVSKFQKLFYTSGTVFSTQIISSYLNDIEIYGRILAEKALEKDFISFNLLMKLVEDDNISHIDLLIGRSVKFAYCIVTCHKFINGTETFISYLLRDYIKHDFIAFLNEIQQQSDSSIIYAEISPLQFSLELGVIEDRFMQNLLKSLDNIEKIKKSADLLLQKAKCILQS